MRTRTSLALFLAVLSLPALAEDWPQWRGPTLNGISNETNLPVHWSTTENVAWKLAMPSLSGSTPIIWGNYIFLNVADGDQLYLWCVDKTKGTLLWKTFIAGGNYKNSRQNMSSPSPVTDGKGAYVMTGVGVLKGFDFSGNELWMRDLQKEYGKFGLNWGYASSPLLYEDSLYVQVLQGGQTQDPSYVMRIGAKDGKTVWRVIRPSDAVQDSKDAYTTPMLLRSANGVEIVILGGDCITGYDPATGEELWRGSGFNPEKEAHSPIMASPVIVDDVIYAPGWDKPLLAFRAGGRGDISQSNRLWSFKGGPLVPTPVTDGKYFYSINVKGILSCLDAKSGQAIGGRLRLPPSGYSSSLVLADDKLYATSDDGVTTVLKAGPKFEVLAENDLSDYTLSSPAISDGHIFLRTAQFLYSIGKP